MDRKGSIMISDFKDWSDRLVNYRLIDISIIIFNFVIVFLFFSIFLSIIPILYQFYKIILDFPSTTLHVFVSNVLPLIDFALLDAVLFMVAVGIRVVIVEPLKVKREFKLKKAVPNITKYLGLPFLTMIASILTVSILELAAELYVVLQRDTPIEDKKFLYYIFLILSISFAIVAISMLIKTEHKLLDHSETLLEDPDNNREDR